MGKISKVFGFDAPDNSKQIRKAREEAAEAKKREERAKSQQKKTQERTISQNRSRRRRAFRRFSLMQTDSTGDSDTTLG
jgi:hypothetical protein